MAPSRRGISMTGPMMSRRESTGIGQGAALSAVEDVAGAAVEPKLAIVIACYNYEAFVGCAIQSVLGQMRDDCELLVVDDGSTDGSWNVIDRLNVRATRCSNMGQLGACLLGVERTRAPFILFLDADDVLKPGALDVIVRHLDSEVAKLQFSLARIDQSGAQISAAHTSVDAYRDRAGLVRQILRTAVYKSPPTSGNVFRRDLCEVAREATSYERCIDGVMLFAAPFLGDVVSLSEQLGSYRVHQRNHSGLGRPPDPATIQRDMDRFVARIEHLRAFIRPLDLDRMLVDPKKVFYYRELAFSLVVASGQRPRLLDLPGLLFTLAGESIAARNKAALASYFVIVSFLPNIRARAMLAYRYGAKHRSFGGFVRQLVSPVA